MAQKRQAQITQNQAEESINIDEKFIEGIISRAEPFEDQQDLRFFLMNVLLFIKRVDGFDLTDEERKYPTHAQFAHTTYTKGRDTAEGLKNRLKIIERFQIRDVQRIINIIASTAVSSPKGRLTPREIQLILELHKNPLATQYELAQRLSTTAQAIRQKLIKLRRHFSLAVIHNVDYHKLRLTLMEVDFRTKSLKASEQLEHLYRKTPPLWLRRIAFDHDYRLGYLTYLMPDQPKAHQMLANRVRWLEDEFLEESTSYKVLNSAVSISFNSYDPVAGKWFLNIDTISEAILQFIRHQKKTPTQIRKWSFTEPMPFDEIDYILAQTPYIFGEKQRIAIRQKVLEQHGYTLSNKTLWYRERKLHQAGLFHPAIWFDIPGLEEVVQFTIECAPECFDHISRISSFLPYTYLQTSKTSLFFTFQRPNLCSSITGLLVRMISQEEGVSKLRVIRYEPTFSPQMLTQTVSRWDNSRQRWIIQEGDI